MMKKLRYLFSTFLLLLVAGVTWADSKTLTVTLTGFGGTATGYATNVSAKDDGNNITLVANQLNRSTGQVRGNQTSVANNFNIANTEEIPGYITGIKIETTTGTGTFSAAMNAAVGTTSQASATSGTAGTKASDSKSISWNFDASNKYTYFRLFSAAKFTSGSVIGCVITITYEEGTSGPTLLDPNLAFAEASGTVALDGTATLPALTNDGDGAVTYSSSETGVATVSETTGGITLVGVGTTVITATSAATSTYKAGSAEYTLNVTPGGTLIWSEDFSNGVDNYTLKNGDSATKLYESDNLAGGTAPELLIGKTSGSFTATIPLQGYYGNLTLGFKANKNNAPTVSTTTADVTIGSQTGENPYYYTINVPSGTPNLELTFSNTTSANVRVDDFVLYGITKSDKNNAELAFAQTSVSLEVGQTTTIAFTKATSATVTFENSDPTVATYNEATGEVEALAAGTATITVSSEETDDYTAGIATLVITVTEPLTLTGDGTEENPYTVADALALLADGQTPTGVYVKGIVSQVDEVSTQHGNATYWISDDGTTDNQMEAYRGKYLENANFTSEDQIQVGDEVVVTGNIVLYGDNKIPEFSQGNYLYSLTRNTPEVTKYYLMGIGGDWTTGIEFTYDASSNTYTLPDQAIDAATQVKIMDGEKNWYGTAADGLFWITADNHTDIVMTTGNNEPNYYFNEAGTYTFTISFSDTDAPLLTVTGWPEPKYYLAGSFDGWGDGVEFTYNEDNNTYTATQAVENGTEFKVKYGLLTDPNNFTWYGGITDDGQNYRVHEEWFENIPLNNQGNNFVIEISEPTTLTFTLDPDALTLTVTGWPEAPVEGAEKYVLVTDASELAEGDEIIFVAVGSATVSGSSVNFTKAMADANTEKHIFNVTDVTVNEDNTVTVNDNVSKWTLGSVEGTTTANWTFKNGNNYLAATGTSKNNYLETIEEVNANSIATIEFENNVASVIFTSDNRNVLSYNNNSDTGDNTKARFSCYANVQNQSLYIYKKQLLTTIDVTIGESGYATLYYSDMNLVVPEGVTATTYKVTEGSLAESKTYEPNDVIPAATGVVLYTVKPATYSFTITSQAGEADADNMLQGTDAATTISEAGYKYYILSKSKDGQKIGFYYQNEDGSAVNNGAHKAYLPVPEAAAGGAKGWSFDGEATGIRSIEAGAGVENAVIYNLSGVRMNSQNLPKGIYIVNGKKMVVK